MAASIPPSARPARGTGPWVVVLLPSVLLGVLGWMHRWTEDDAFINYRVVDQLLAGNGPVFNLGERVEVATSTLWLAILTVFHAVLPFVSLEWVALLLGLVLTVGGLAAASVAAHLLTGSSAHLALPLGAVVFLALPPAWDFTTSGLETGLSFGWLGGVFLALVMTERGWADRPRGRWRPGRLDMVAIVVGLGPLIRPDFAIFTLVFLVLALLVSGPHSRRSAARIVVLAAVAPVVYQVCRMGYFALLVPNTALAKEASKSWWDQGFAYAWDTIGTYGLCVPLIVLLAWLGLQARQHRRAGRREVSWLLVLPVVAGLLHMLFVVKVGGDYMHGRLMLPGIFAILMPVATVPVSRNRTVPALAAALIFGWASVCAAGLRTPYAETNLITDRGLADDRGHYRLFSGQEHPVTLDDYAATPLVQAGRDAARRARADEEVLILSRPPARELPPRRRLRTYPVLVHGNMGMLGYSAGVDVRVVDELGLGDPVASRLDLPRRGRVGHEKDIDRAWTIARFSDAGLLPPDLAANAQVGHAGRALECGVLREILAAVSSPMSPRRFLDNLALAPRATSARVDPTPERAAAEMCD